MNKIITIINILTPILTVFISSLISYAISKSQAKAEIKRTLMSYDREDKKLLNDAFVDLITKTEEFCSFGCLGNMQDAIQANSKFLTLAPEQFRAVLLDMDTALKNSNSRNIEKLRKDIIDIYTTTV